MRSNPIRVIRPSTKLAPRDAVWRCLPTWVQKVLLTMLLASSLAGAAPAVQAQLPSEASVKAAFLYKFLAYVDWPATALTAANSPLVIGVLGADALGAELQAITAGRQVNGRPVLTRRMSNGDTLEGLHVVFVGRGAPSGVLERLRGRSILVVAEDGLEPGVMLNFVPIGGRVRFEAAPVAAERVGLKLGARLLAVAERVVAQ
jgi:hypothetical protein